MKRFLCLLCAFCLIFGALLSLSACDEGGNEENGSAPQENNGGSGESSSTSDDSDTSGSGTSGSGTPGSGTPGSGTPTPRPNPADALEGKTDREKALYVYEYQMKEPDYLTSYTIEMNASFAGIFQEIPFSGEINGTILMANRWSDRDLFYCDTTSISMRMGDGDEPLFSNSMTTKSGYFGESMFYYEESGEADPWGVIAPHTASEYRAYQAAKDKEDEIVITGESCNRVTFETITGGYRATFAEFVEGNDSFLDQFLGGFDTGIFDQPCVDMELVLEVNEDLLPTKMTYDLIFEPADGEECHSSFRAEGIYSKYNQTAPLLLDISSYRNIGNMIEAEKTIDALAKRKEAKTLQFIYCETMIVDLNGQQQSLNFGDYTVDIRNGAEGYTFSFRNGETEDYIEYNNGIMTTRYGQSSCTDESAKQYMEFYIDPADLSLDRLSDYYLSGNYSYFVIEDVDLSPFYDVLDSIGADESDITNTRAEYSYKHSGTTPASNTVQYDVELTVVTSAGEYTITYQGFVASVLEQL